MRKNSRKQLEKMSTQFHLWDNILKEYWLLVDEADELARCDISRKLHGLLFDIFKIFLSEGHFKDSWDLPPKIHMGPFDEAIVLRSEKQQEDYSFGICSQSGFYLQSNICCAWNVKDMPDEFWQYCTELNKFGSFSYQEGSLPNETDNTPLMKTLLHYGNSNIYRMIRNSILWSLEKKSAEDSGYDTSIDFGSIRVTWPPYTSWQDLILNGSEVFRRSYKMNYMLYRNEYHRNISRKKRLLKMLNEKL